MFNKISSNCNIINIVDDNQLFKNKDVNENKVELERLDIINNEKTKKETEDMIINSHFKTLEDTLKKKKAELERLDAILNERNAEIAELNKIGQIYIKNDLY